MHHLFHADVAVVHPGAWAAACSPMNAPPVIVPLAAPGEER